MKRIALSLLLVPVALSAQTTINGGRIIKGTLDASGSSSSLPHRTGSGSPAGRDNCGKPGETYFQTDAAAGQNLWACTAAGTPGTWNQVGAGASVTTGTTVPSGTCSAGALYVRTDVQQFYICAATNVWQLASYTSGLAANRPANCAAGQLFLATDAGTLSFCASPGNPGTWQAVSPSTTVSLNGVSQGAYSTLNLVNPTGLNWTLTPVGQTLSIAPTPDTTYLLSQAAAQNGSPFLCAPASNNGAAYSCNLVPALGVLANGMLVEFRPDVSCVGGSTTLNINGLGAKPIYSLDGASSPAANDCRANRHTWLVYSTALNSGVGAFVMQSVANLPATAPVSATVAFSATPAFSVTGTIQEFTMTLTGNVTSSTLSGAAANSILIFNICQDATGNRSFTWPSSGFSAAPSISSSASSCTRQIFVWDGSNANPIAPATSTNTPYLLSGAGERAAPATPGSGLASLWADSTRHTFTSTENNNANAHIMPRTAGSTDQLVSTDLSDTANLARVNAGNTFTAGTQNFSGAAHTLPAVTGLTAGKPATCTTGEMYFATDATAGQNWYYCTATNTWTQQVNGGGGGVTSIFGRTGAVVATSGDYTAAQVTNAAQTNASNTFSTGTQSFAAAQHIIQNNGTAASKPSTCTLGETYFATDATAGRNWYFCTATNTWTAEADLVSSVFGRTGAVTAQSGDYTAAQVTNAAQTNASNTFSAGTQDFHAAAHTLPAVTGLTASKPATCATGEMYFATDATAGQNWYFCTAANVWTQQLNSGGGNASITATTVTFSVTPTFTRSTNIQEFTLTLAGNVTSSTLSGAVAADVLYFNICQDATGGRTMVFPTGFSQAPTISATAAVCTKFAGTWDGSALQVAGAPTATDTPFLISQAPERAAPATPAAGYAALWPGLTRHTWTSTENNSANVHIMPRTAGSTDQLASTDLSDTANLVYNNASNTYTAGTQNFSGAAHTIPALTGTAASKPSTCTVGEMYFATDATAGQNWYYCTSTNTWTQQLNSGGGGGYATIDSNGSSVTQRATVNFIGGTNATVSCVDNSGATRTDCTVSSTGGSGNIAPFVDSADHGTSSTSPTTLSTVTITGGTLASGKGVHIVAAGINAQVTNTIAITFGATTIFTINIGASSWNIDCTVWGTGVATEKSTCGQWDSGNNSHALWSTPAETLSGNITVSVVATASSASANAATSKLLVVNTVNY